MVKPSHRENLGIQGRLQDARVRMDGAGSTNEQDGLQRINGAHTVRPFFFEAVVSIPTFPEFSSVNALYFPLQCT